MSTLPFQGGVIFRTNPWLYIVYLVYSISRFLGLAGYYRKFIPSFSSIAAPLLQLTQKVASFIWTDACEPAFQRLKQFLCSAPILAHPDFGKEFVLQTDASDYGVGTCNYKDI